MLTGEGVNVCISPGEPTAWATCRTPSIHLALAPRLMGQMPPGPGREPMEGRGPRGQLRNEPRLVWRWQ